MAHTSLLFVSEGECAEQLCSAFKVIGLSLDKTPSLFENKEVCILEYLCKGEKNCAVEIRFRNATLSCLFDGNTLCDSSYLFLDDQKDLKDYIEYCNRTYDYNYIMSAWVTEKLCLQVKYNDGDYFFIASPASALCQS
ncbi:hypothetical protein [Parabacteroides hominis]|jgi:hypothetical protein|uniref:Uncharacterized protein n=1 Tax=Parabacteroides hominis TaxID=2763057 RepID=A0ABR7DPH6_9BACT|nr:hypothetical protein [Parabacteroides hominis]MBC5633343.1 hypothetical protein [Parabacteroides hominis]